MLTTLRRLFWLTQPEITTIKASYWYDGVCWPNGKLVAGWETALYIGC